MTNPAPDNRSVAELLEIDVVIAFDAWHFKHYGYHAQGPDHALGLAAFKGAYEEIHGFNEAVAQIMSHIKASEEFAALPPTPSDDEVLIGYFVGRPDAPFYRNGNKIVPRFGVDYKRSLLDCARTLIGSTND